MEFFKMAGSGNDFVVVDNRKKVINNRKAAALKLCDRKFGVGSDGLLLVEDSKKADFRMRFFNPDGSEAEMCGNGLRCIVRFVSEKVYRRKTFNVETKAGVLEGFVGEGSTVRVQLNVLGEASLGMKIPLGRKTVTGHYINTGVPHLVIFAADMEKVELEKIGPAVRYHDLFAPGGTNVNWIQVADRGRVKIRTYERGVEAETLSCGTGSVAGAIVSSLLGKTVSPVDMVARSGETLRVSFDSGLKKVYLEGKTLLAFKGEWIGA